MGSTWEEVLQDYATQEEYTSELNEEAIQAFKTGRLRSYYLEHPVMAKPALGMMGEMDSLREQHPLAALIFAASAIEITIKDLLVKPILSGLVHSENLADIVMGLAPREVGSDPFRNLLFKVLDKTADVDLRSYKRSESNKILWDEYKTLREARNKLIHVGDGPSKYVLETFHPVAHEFLGVIFPKVLRNLGLETTGYLLIHSQTEYVGVDDQDEDSDFREG